MLEMENRANIYRMDMVASMETVKNKLEENVDSILKTNIVKSGDY